jgi:hypothetical protein
MGDVGHTSNFNSTLFARRSNSGASDATRELAVMVMEDDGDRKNSIVRFIIVLRKT